MQVNYEVILTIGRVAGLNSKASARFSLIEVKDGGADAVRGVAGKPIGGNCVCSVGGRCVQEPCAVWVWCLCCARACMETVMLKCQKRRHGGTSHEAWQTGTTKACDKGGQNKERGAYLEN